MSIRVAIQYSPISFSERWVAYCKEKKIDYVIVDCYRNDIIQQLKGCDALMWHFHHTNEKDVLFAKQLLYAVQLSGKKVFPDFNTMWHFDDKVGQKYLLESFNIPFVPTYVFYTYQDASNWAALTNFPKVFKLRSGSGSNNVQLVRNHKQAQYLIEIAFGKGFKDNGLTPVKEMFQGMVQGTKSFSDFLKRLLRVVNPTNFSKLNNRHKGYIYFQDFVEGNTFDTRVIVVEQKAFAIKRLVRKKDFRASGSGKIIYIKQEIDERLVELSFKINSQLKTQCIAFDYILKNDSPMLIEISFGFLKEGYDRCPGYWDADLKWHEGPFNPYGWMIENLLTS